MEALELNMHVRTEHGIYKINGYINNNYTQKFTYIDNKGVSNILEEKEIIKASYNIIDLIEVGDYVNGWKVLYWTDGTKVVDDGYATNLDKISVKSILTKEQFESMKYEVE